MKSENVAPIIRVEKGKLTTVNEKIGELPL